MDLKHLDRDDVVRIYDHLVEEFSTSEDPIAPAGIKDENLLISAVNRQWVGGYGNLKYTTPVQCAATLAYGICKNHCFYNGNKRTALVGMLAHLDRNKLSVWGLSQDDLYDFMLAVADNRVTPFVEGGIPASGTKASSDSEVDAMARYLGAHSYAIVRGEQRITYKDLRKILRRYGYDLGEKKNSFISIVRITGGGPVNFDRIIYPGENRDVEISAIKRVREKCRLREEDGVDSEAFYFDYIPLDDFVNKYRIVLRRLGQT